MISRDERLVSKEVVISAETVNATATVTSSVMRASYAEHFSFLLKISVGAAPKVNLEYQVINSDLNNVDDIGSGKDSFSEWVTPTTNGTIASNLTATAADGFAPAVTKWIRFRVVGQAGNSADTLVTLTILSQ
jgi:hypothetical protein